KYRIWISRKGSPPMMARPLGKSGRTGRKRVPSPPASINTGSDARRSSCMHVSFIWRPGKRSLGAGRFGAMENDAAGRSTGFQRDFGEAAQPLPHKRVLVGGHKQQQETAAARAEKFPAQGTGVKAGTIHVIHDVVADAAIQLAFQQPGPMQNLAKRS